MITLTVQVLQCRKWTGPFQENNSEVIVHAGLVTRL